MGLYWLGLLALGFALSACSIHPLPEQVTGFDTVQIVAKVRCEVRDGLRSYVTGYLSDPAVALSFRRGEELASKLIAEPLQWRRLRPLLKEYGAGPGVMAVFERYNGGAIAYEFLFNGTENNMQSGSIDLLRILTNGSVTGNIGASSTFDRNNMRNFMISDNFEILTTAVDYTYCGPGSANGTEPEHREAPNFVYPVAGALGLQELVGAFLNLNQSGNLVGLPNAPATAGQLPTISEGMKFTTTLTGGGSFGFTAAAPMRPAIRLTKASMASTNKREDIHTLRIVIKLPLEGQKETRTIAEQRLLSLGVPLPQQRSTAALVQTSALVDLSLAPGKEYIETKILVGQRGVLLPD